MKQNYNRLKDFKCPECRAGLIDKVSAYECSKPCGFRISKEKFDETVKSLYRRPIRWEGDDRLAELNNLGHDVVTEDFSDSPFLQ